MIDKTPGPASTTHPARNMGDDWKPRRTYLVGTKAHFPKVRLIEENSARWIFSPEGNSPLMGWLQILAGCVLVGTTLWYFIPGKVSWSSILYLLNFLLWSAILIITGLVRFKVDRTQVSFDLRSKLCRLGYRRGPDHVGEMEEEKPLARLDEVRAVQFLNVLDSLFWDTRCYELNLVMEDDSRVYVVGARRPEPLHEDAIRLAAFLGKPLLEASTQSPSEEYTWPLGCARPVRRRRSRGAP